MASRTKPSGVPARTRAAIDDEAAEEAAEGVRQDQNLPYVPVLPRARGGGTVLPDDLSAQRQALRVLLVEGTLFDFVRHDRAAQAAALAAEAFLRHAGQRVHGLEGELLHGPSLRRSLALHLGGRRRYEDGLPLRHESGSDRIVFTPVMRHASVSRSRRVKCFLIWGY